VYGEPAKVPIEESDVTVPVSPYGVSKLAAERYVAVYARLYGLRAASLRLFSVYGPYQTKQVVYDLLVKLRQSPHRLVVLGDGSQMRDLVYVADVVRAFLGVAARGRTDGFAYNVASGVGTTIAELAQAIVEVQAAPATIAFTGRTRPGDPERWIGSSAALAALGAAPRYRLRDGLRETAAWFNASTAAAAAGADRVDAPHRPAAQADVAEVDVQ
jgi:UDP-glucose 4-epimerase